MAVHHRHYPYSRTNLYNLYSESVYSEYEHQQKSSIDQPQRQTSSPYPYPQRSRMDIEIVSPLQRHMQATPVQLVSTESIVQRQQSENFHQEHSMEMAYTEDRHFSCRQHHMQGIPGIQKFSQWQFSSSLPEQQQQNHFQMMATPSHNSTYPARAQPQTQTPVTPPFGKTAQCHHSKTLVMLTTRRFIYLVHQRLLLIHCTQILRSPPIRMQCKQVLLRYVVFSLITYTYKNQTITPHLMFSSTL